MKKNIIILISILMLACGSAPKSTPQDMCIQEKEEIKKLENQKKICNQENATLKELLDTTLKVLSLVGITILIVDYTK